MTTTEAATAVEAAAMETTTATMEPAPREASAVEAATRKRMSVPWS